MLDLFLWSAILFPHPPTLAGLASRYGYPGDPGDVPAGHRACRAALVARWGAARWASALAAGVASRDLPCGTRLLLASGGPVGQGVRLAGRGTGRGTDGGARVVIAYVVDRGPYGQLLPGGRYVASTRLQPGARWRGVLDLLPGVAARLGLRGLQPVVAWRVD